MYDRLNRVLIILFNIYFKFMCTVAPKILDWQFISIYLLIFLCASSDVKKTLSLFTSISLTHSLHLQDTPYSSTDIQTDTCIS